MHQLELQLEVHINMPNRHTTLTSLFTDIAGAIRSKTGDSAEIKADDFDTAIKAIKTGGSSIETIELSVNQNGNYIPDEGKAYSKVSVNVPQTADSGTLKSLLDATKSSAYLFNNYTGRRVDSLISYSDTSNVTNMSSMFSTCSNLTTIPELNTSKVTNMRYMLDGCSSLTTIPQFDTSNVINMIGMFHSCRSLTSIPELNTSNVTDMSFMFQNCSSLTTIPQFNTSKVKDMSNMFQNCSSLTTIPQLDVSNVKSSNRMFVGCSSLKSILMTGMKVSFDISSSTKFDESDLVTILNNLATLTSTASLKMGTTNLAKLTDDEKAIATNKGWTLA